MKGYHVDFAKNKTVKNPQVDEKTVKVEVKTLPLVKEEPIVKEDVKVNVEEKVSDTKIANKNVSESEKKGRSVLNNSLVKASEKIIKHNKIIRSLIEKNKKILADLKARTSNKKSRPFDQFFGGGGSTFASIILYALGSIIAFALISFLIFLLLAIASGGAFPTWIGPFLLGLGLIILVVIVVVVILNAD
jgi:hypothetical protein